AQFTQADVERLLDDKGIVRHRGKIASVVNNARRAQELIRQEGSLAAYVWRFEPKAHELAAPQTASTSAASIAMSKDLKKRGWSFVGPTTVYAFMQAMGLVNDHARGWVIRDAAAQARAAFQPPRTRTGRLFSENAHSVLHRAHRARQRPTSHRAAAYALQACRQDDTSTSRLEMTPPNGL